MSVRTYPGQGLHAEILQELGHAIANGVFSEGVLLPRESELQERFGAGRQTVREAIKVLAAKGMVRARRRAGTAVQPRSSWNLLDPDVLHWHSADAVPQQMLRDLFEIRYLIEPASAQFAARRGEPEKLERIAQAVEAMRDAHNDPDRFYEADIEFHLAVWAASSNELIDRLSTILRPLLEVNFSVRPHLAPGGIEAAYRHHAAVYEAIAKHDAIGARRAMEALLDRASGELFEPGSADAPAPQDV
jgi:GntR family galactonate operon transcriptional repressor